MEEGDYDAAREAFNRALTIAGHQGDLALESRTLASAAFGELLDMHFPECQAKSMQAIKLARSIDEPVAESQAGWLATMSMVLTGDVEKARLHASDAVTSAERVRERFSLGSALWANATMYTLEGQWQKARDSINDALVPLQDVAADRNSDSQPGPQAGCGRHLEGPPKQLSLSPHAHEAAHSIISRRRLDV